MEKLLSPSHVARHNHNHSHSGAIKLPPGFRFHPTDEELVVQYLRRKAFSCPLPAAIIPEIDLGKHSPWDLPGGWEHERYFFAVREAKYPNGSRSNRATGCGYWKATGKDRAVVASRSSQVVVGMKKTLVFYRGKAPTGSRTDWVMHEYRLASSPHRKNSTNSAVVVPQRDWVLCRIFMKKRAGGGMDVDGHEENRPVGYIDFLGRQSDDRRRPPSSPTHSDSSCVTEAADESSNGDDASSTP